MNTTMRTYQQERQFKKLIRFLRKLPAEKFDFGSEVSEAKSNGHVCPTVACAIGWTPTLFPKRVQIEWRRKLNNDWVFDGFLLDGEAVYFKDVARELFAVPETDDLFYPNGSIESGFVENSCGYHATSFEVATMLDNYRKATPHQTFLQFFFSL